MLFIYEGVKFSLVLIMDIYKNDVKFFFYCLIFVSDLLIVIVLVGLVVFVIFIVGLF